jgi:hypothetical protein
LLLLLLLLLPPPPPALPGQALPDRTVTGFVAAPSPDAAPMPSMLGVDGPWARTRSPFLSRAIRPREPGTVSNPSF